MQSFKIVASRYLHRCVLLDNYKLAIFVDKANQLYIHDTILNLLKHDITLDKETLIKVGNSSIFIFDTNSVIDFTVHAILCEDTIPETIMRNFVKPKVDPYIYEDGSAFLNPNLIRFSIEK